MKKLFTAVLTLGLAISTLFGATKTEASINFSDVPTNHWAYETIKRASELGYVKGKGDGTFGVNDNVTRAEFAQFFARLFDGTERVKEPFTDVNDTHWAKDAIEEMIALGVINVKDYSNNRFEPTKVMTRSEISKWLTNALAVKHPSYQSIMTTIRDSVNTLLPTTEYLRGNIAKAEQGYIGVMLGTGLFTGHVDGSFKPTGNTSRSEVATLLIRFKDLSEKAPTEFKGLNELVEVSETGSNILSATKYEYAFETTYKNVINKPLTLNDNVGTFKLNRLIFVETGKSPKEAMNNSIYGKMFFNEKNETRFFADRVTLFIEQTVKPNKVLDALSFSRGSNTGYIYPSRLNDTNAKVYKLETLPLDYTGYFIVGKEKRFWTNKVLDTKDIKLAPYKANDGSTVLFYSTY